MFPEDVKDGATVRAMAKIAVEFLVFLGDPMFQRANRICLYRGVLGPNPFARSTRIIPADDNQVNLNGLEAAPPVFQCHAFAFGRHVLVHCPRHALRDFLTRLRFQMS